MRIFSKRKKQALGLALLLLFGVFTALFLGKQISFNHPSKRLYPIRGVDLSEYQGTVDFSRLAEQDVQFVFLKATEGSSYVDECFFDNLEKIQQTDLAYSGYHFFSFESQGETQAQNYIQAVPQSISLPPVVDVEFYGDFFRNPANPEWVEEELSVLLNLLEEHYGKKPILYATKKAYDAYLDTPTFKEYPLWMRDVYFPPGIRWGQEWVFWQYSDRAILDGYQGKEKYIDMNVFYGSEADWALYLEENRSSTPL